MAINVSQEVVIRSGNSIYECQDREVRLHLIRFLLMSHRSEGCCYERKREITAQIYDGLLDLPPSC